MRDRRHLTPRYSGRPQVDAAELARWCVLLNYSEGKLAEAESIHQTPWPLEAQAMQPVDTDTLAARSREELLRSNEVFFDKFVPNVCEVG